MKQQTYAILMQENNFFNRNAYLAMLEKAHNKMIGAASSGKNEALQLKLDHFFHAQSQKMT